MDNKNALEPAVNNNEGVIEHVYVRSGSTCPHCGKGKMDYNGLLELQCQACGYTLSSGAGCS